MASIVLIGICACVVLHFLYKYVFTKPHNFPPGPPRLPIFGSYLFILLANYNHIHKATAWLASFYKSKLVGLYYGNTLAVTVHDLEVCKEVLVNPDLDGRPIFMLVKARDPEFDVKGIFFRDGLFWKEQRRFTLRHLRDFGFGRRFEDLEIHINDELLSFISLIKNGPKFDYEKPFVKDGLVLFPKIFEGNPANLFLQVLTNDRFNRQDLETMHKAGDAALKFQRSADVYGRMFSVVEIFRHIFPKLSGYTEVRQSAMDLYNIIQKIVHDQYNTYDEKHERHFMDLYFKEFKEHSSFSLNQLVHTIVDFIFPALTAIGIQLTFALQRLILSPETMAKCQEEIDNVIGRGRLPSLDDRINLSWTEASLRESLRIDTIAPNGVPHLSLRDTKIGGYDLPKGSLVLTVLQAAHVDEDSFKDAKLFKPERFLDSKNKLSLKLDTSIPFGAGKRLCAGETFARNIMFLFLAAILQNFNVTIPPGYEFPHPDLDLQPTGVVRSPPNFWLKFESR